MNIATAIATKIQAADGTGMMLRGGDIVHKKILLVVKVQLALEAVVMVRALLLVDYHRHFGIEDKRTVFERAGHRVWALILFLH